MQYLQELRFRFNSQTTDRTCGATRTVRTTGCGNGRLDVPPDSLPERNLFDLETFLKMTALCPPLFRFGFVETYHLHGTPTSRPPVHQRERLASNKTEGGSKLSYRSPPSPLPFPLHPLQASSLALPPPLSEEP
mmetsp:Transcript_24809/g.48630  ORF Transcript_24809/g.48630 Transcript_24809/m.48630 type:complete len:134 (+) Transcript_24809:198-599(+)